MSNPHEPVPTDASTSTGLALTEANFLDDHFEAMRPEYEAMLNSVGVQPGWTVLDAGCGGGSFLPLMATLVGHTGAIHALDLAPENVAMVQQRASAQAFVCPVDARIGQLTALPYADHTFDAVWCANVTQYLSDDELTQMLAEFRRVIRPGGLVAIKEFDLTGSYLDPLPRALWWHLFDVIQYVPQLHGVLRTIELPTWLEQVGFMQVRYQSTSAERRPPLREVEKRYIATILPIWAHLAEQFGISGDELALWQRLVRNPGAPENIMHQPDFYQREMHGVAVGRVPG